MPPTSLLHVYAVLLVRLLVNTLQAANGNISGEGELQASGLKSSTIEKIIPREKSLMRNLLEDYDVRVRPVINSSNPVVIYHGIAPTQITDLDVVEQVFTFKLWLANKWVDPQLRWNPGDYDGLTVIRVPKQSIWIPDIILYNGTSSEVINGIPLVVDVDSDGAVYWVALSILSVPCQVDVTYFPFDVQRCPMTIGSWMHDNTQMQVIQDSNSVDMKSYLSNGEWDVVEVTAVGGELSFQRVDKYQYIEYKFTLRRRPLYYMINIVFPCVWLSILSVMTFWLPPDSGEKITLGITVLVAFSVFMLLVAKSIPKTSNSVPLLGIYLCVTMSLTSLTIIATIIVKKISYVGPETPRMPQWLRKLTFRYLTKLLCIHGTSMRRRLCSAGDRLADKVVEVSSERKSTPNSKSAIDRSRASITTERERDVNCQQRVKPSDMNCQSKEKTVDDKVCFTTEEEWKIFGLVLEILLFLVHAAVTVLVTLGLFVVVPFNGEWYSNTPRE